MKTARTLSGLLIVIPIALSTGCRELPEAKWSQLGGLRREVRQQGVGPYAPERTRRFDDQYLALQQTYVIASHEFSFLRDIEELERSIDAAIVEAGAILQEARQKRQSLKDSQQQNLTQIGSSLSEARKRNHLNRTVRNLLVQAQLKHARAFALWKNGKYLDAAPVVEELLAVYKVLESNIASVEERYEDPVLRRLWAQWRKQTVDWSRGNGKYAVVVEKRRHAVQLFRSGMLVKEYAADLGWGTPADKLYRGDGATPEGMYKVQKKKGQRQTKYFLALLLDYPNAQDRQIFRQAKQQGRVESEAGIGGLIEIHGDGGQGKDWTDGCVAIDNAKMTELFELSYVGMPVTIIGDSGE